jgi:large subunit ribosomal protein L23
MLVDQYSHIRGPLVTEKSTAGKDNYNQVVFVVDLRANKIQIKKAVEKIFKVKVLKVRTQRVPGKTRRMGRSFGERPDWKKAFVTLRAGDRIEFFEGV